MNRSLAINSFNFRVVASSFYGEMKTEYWNGIKGNLQLMKERTCSISSPFPHASFPAGFLSGLGVSSLYQCSGDEEPDQGRALSASLHYKHVRHADITLQEIVDLLSL